MKKNFLIVLMAGFFIISSQSSIEAVMNPELVEQNRQKLQEQKQIQVDKYKGVVEKEKEEAQVRIQEKTQEKKEELEQKKVEVQNRIQENRDKFFQGHAERLENRFINTYYQRLSSIIEKTQQRFEIMTQNGKDLSMAKAKLEEAKKELETAKQLSQSTVNQFRQIKTNDQKELALQARDTAEKARNQFKNVISLIKEAVVLAKKA